MTRGAASTGGRPLTTFHENCNVDRCIAGKSTRGPNNRVDGGIGLPGASLPEEAAGRVGVVRPEPVWRSGMEYLVVRFPQSRAVMIDGEFNGLTGRLIELEAGTHTISLGPPPNFTPESQQVVLKDTSALNPKEVVFHES